MKTDAGQEKNPCPGLKGGVPRYNKSSGKQPAALQKENKDVEGLDSFRRSGYT